MTIARSCSPPPELSKPEQDHHAHSDEEYNEFLRSLGHVPFSTLKEPYVDLPSADRTSRLKITVLSIGELFIPFSHIIYEEKPSDRILPIPDYAFLIERYEGDRVTNRVLFDLGLRQSSSPMKDAWRQSYKKYNVKDAEKSAAQLLSEDLKLNLESDLDAVILSHDHFDHVGELSQFPSSVQLVLGADTPTKLEELADALDVPLSDLESRSIRWLDRKSDQWQRVGSCKAVDYFGDGNLFLAHTPGHKAGHIAAFLRHSDDNYLILGGDCAHHHDQIHVNTGEKAKIGLFNKPGESRLSSFDDDLAEAYRSLSRLSRVEEDKRAVNFIAHDASFASLLSKGQITHLDGTPEEFKQFKTCVDKA